MKRPALYPFLFLLLIILSPLTYNIDQLDPSLAFRPLVLSLLVSLGAAVLFYFIFKDWQYDLYLIFLITLYFFGFGYFNRFVHTQLVKIGRPIDERVLLAIFTALLGILAIKKIWARLGGRTWLASYLNIVVGLWLLIPAFELLTGLVIKPVLAKESPIPAEENIAEITLDCSNTPDIYYIILDAYGRADALADLHGLDNQPFMEFLERRGFYVADQSHTNYIQTVFSIPSSLNFSYINPPAEGVAGRVYFSDLVQENAIMSALERCGYTRIAIESGFFFTDHPEVDLYLEHRFGPNEFESLLLADSPVDVLADELNLETSEQNYETHRERVLYSFEMLEKIPQMSGPKFVFAHILSPHPPFVFDKDGQPLDPPRPYFIGDGDDFQGSLDEYVSGYAEQVQFVNGKLEQVVGAILEKSATSPIIILQGDHGPGSRLVWDKPDQTCLWERTPILNAYYLPGEVYNGFYPSISPVNTFRIILNTYFGTSLQLLPDSTYFTSHSLERQAIDITARRTSRAKCTAP